jgi:hypothetical protein
MITLALPGVNRETHLKSSSDKIPALVHYVLGLPVPFPTSTWYIQLLRPAPCYSVETEPIALTT